MTVSIIALGGDPTGRNDSASAFDAAIAAAAALVQANSLPAAVGSGGVVIDLGGGVYRLSRPILIHGYSNSGFTVSGGTLLADASSFPADGYLLDVAQLSGLAFRDLTFDSVHVGGGLKLDNIVQIDVTGCFFLHYQSDGIYGGDALGASHELMLDDCFFAEFMCACDAA